MKRAKIDTFTTHNDTDRWVVSVDGFIQSFASFEEANKIYKQTTPEGHHHDESVFGDCSLLPPGYLPINRLATVLNEPEDMTTCRVSEIMEINLADYIAKHERRAHDHFALQEATKYTYTPAWKRLSDKKDWSQFFANNQ